MKYLVFTILLTSYLFSSSRIETKSKCIDGYLYYQTVVLHQTDFKTWEPVSASLAQAFKWSTLSYKPKPIECESKK